MRLEDAAPALEKTGGGYHGIPHAMTHCGSRSGYTLISFDGDNYKMRFKAPRRPADDQLHVYAYGDHRF